MNIDSEEDDELALVLDVQNFKTSDTCQSVSEDSSAAVTLDNSSAFTSVVDGGIDSADQTIQILNVENQVYS